MVRITAIILLILCVLPLQAQKKTTTITDAATGLPLARASIFDRKGNLIGVCNDDGTLPFVFEEVYPLTIRYMGYNPATIRTPRTPVVRLTETIQSLPEVTVNPGRQEVLHLTGYMREYSTLTSYTDTVTLFREKMVDFMIPTSRAKHYRGWLNPRILNVRSYYRFANPYGPDSVSNYFSRHFSWADWVGIADEIYVPKKLRTTEAQADTLPGRYGTASRWQRCGDDYSVYVDILADSTNRQWVPAIESYMHGQAEFDKFNVHYRFGDVQHGIIRGGDLQSMSFNIESTGRGRSIFQVFKKDEPYFVSTYAELYITDKEYLTVKQAREQEKNPPEAAEVNILAPAAAPALQPQIQELIARVEAIDHIQRRINLQPDKRLAGFDDLFKTRRSSWRKFWDLISPPQYQINTDIFPNAH
ncbi:MAG: hypothetical protein NC402_00930 [Prevotella sp.]|nr:hypothetical protein [Prevotella sp.]MCM1074370.1 hypothetical protein [Ruminococcus sp.]